MESLISIIIPTYNRAHLLAETLDSIVAQTYSHWECIIVDDGSTDATLDVAQAYAKSNTKIKVFTRPNHLIKGSNSCRNFGFSKSKGTFINWFDSDDLMATNKLEKDLQAINSGPYDFTISQAAFFDTETKLHKGVWNENLYSNTPLDDFILLKIGWATNAPLWKRQSIIEAKLSFDEKILTATDYFYHILALSKGLLPIVQEDVLVQQRLHPQRMEHHPKKAAYKLRVLVFIMRHKKEWELEPETVSALKKQMISQLKNLFKHKQWRQGVYFAFSCLPFMPQNIILFVYLALVGAFYALSNKGYRLLD